jgi:hypothetical protein
MRTCLAAFATMFACVSDDPVPTKITGGNADGGISSGGDATPPALACNEFEPRDAGTISLDASSSSCASLNNVEACADFDSPNTRWQNDLSMAQTSLRSPGAGSAAALWMHLSQRPDEAPHAGMVATELSAGAALSFDLRIDCVSPGGQTYPFYVGTAASSERPKGLYLSIKNNGAELEWAALVQAEQQATTSLRAGFSIGVWTHVSLRIDPTWSQGTIQFDDGVPIPLPSLGIPLTVPSKIAVQVGLGYGGLSGSFFAGFDNLVARAP